MSSYRHECVKLMNVLWKDSGTDMPGLRPVAEIKRLVPLTADPI